MKMIEKTRRKFMGITLAAISLVLVFILGLLNVCVYAGIYIEAQENIESIYDRRGFVFSDEFNNDFFANSKGPFSDIMNAQSIVDFMYVKISNRSPDAPFITTNMSDTYSSDTIIYIAEAILEGGETKGLYNNLMFEVKKDDLSTVIVIIDISNDMSIIRTLLLMSVIIIIFSLIFVFIFTYYLSKWAIKPVQSAFENQQRFISDASHELKTPLTVISANADVLESEIGNNKWLDSIKSQSGIMNGLVHDLLDLARLDEKMEEMIKTQLDLSSIVLNKSLEFECTAFEAGKVFEQDITPDISYYGNEESIKHLVTILVDNAIKHSNENGLIRVTLTTDGNKKVFQVFNTGNSIKNSEKDKIFNRFYRSDESRNRATGGYGLGLAIAKSIVDAHNGTISVEGEEDKWVSFTVVLL
ncbi:MAG: GHKL domain-containing protein [Clostridia bacterium]|nr:GHKL domain-containing protein [Clostridia bacterium]